MSWFEAFVRRTAQKPSWIEAFVELMKLHENNRTSWVEREKNIAALRAKYKQELARSGEPYYVDLP